MLGFFIFPIVALVVSIFTTKFSFCVRHFTKKIYYIWYIVIKRKIVKCSIDKLGGYIIMTLYVITKCANGDATNIYYRDEYTARKVFESFIKKYMKDYGADFEEKSVDECIKQNDYMDMAWDKWLHFDVVETQD